MKTTRHSHLPFVPSYIGAGLGFLGFLLLGAVPGTLYGGYMGLALSSVLFGSAAEPSLMARVITGGGMVMGLLAALVMFLIAGAVLGTLVGLPFARSLRRAAESESASANPDDKDVAPQH
jgi:hypothetical protein